jgi:hypothetical protein
MLLTYPLNVVFNNPALTLTENIKFLGMDLDYNLTWKSHVDKFTKKLISNRFVMKKLLPTVNVKTLHMVYYAHYVPKSVMVTMRNVFIIDTGAIRIILRLGPRSSCRQGFKTLDILTVPCFNVICC